MRSNLASLAPLLLGAVLLAPAAAGAEELVARSGSDEVRLSDAPCVHAQTLAHIPPELRGNFHNATGRLGGKAFVGCWRTVGGGAHIVWEDGDQGMVPFAMLAPARKI